MDACGQPFVLTEVQRAVPYVFAELENCRFSHQLTVSDCTYWCDISANHGSLLLDTDYTALGQFQGGSITFLQSSKLESLQTQQQMYTVVWEPMSALYTSGNAKPGILVWCQDDTNNDVLLISEFGAAAVDVVCLAEFCHHLSSCAVQICVYYGADLLPSTGLLIVQATLQNRVPVQFVYNSSTVDAVSSSPALVRTATAESVEHTLCCLETHDAASQSPQIARMTTQYSLNGSVDSPVMIDKTSQLMMLQLAPAHNSSNH